MYRSILKLNKQASEKMHLDLLKAPVVFLLLQEAGQME